MSALYWILLLVLGLGLDSNAIPSYYDDDDEMSLPEFEAFLEEYGDDYGYNGTIDTIRETDMKRMRNDVYLDYTGSGLYRESQLTKCSNLLASDLFGNAHSRSQSSMNTELEADTALMSVMSRWKI